ncbi:MAG: N-acetyltransferase [Rikenellaceae bacterium]
MIKIVPINTKAEIKKFTRFKNNLYKGHPYAVPTLESSEHKLLDPQTNPSLEFCKFQCFLAYNEKGKIVGRIAAIINDRVNDTWTKKEGRFGFFDTIDDYQVAEALLSAAQEWVKQRGMETFVGPMGFTNMDEEGMLVEGYDEPGTMATIYNYPYYVDFVERFGLKKEIDWIEMLLTLPEKMPERIEKFSKIILQKNNLKVIKLNSNKEILKQGWATKIFELINREYSKLFGYNAMTQRQIDHYVDVYIPMVRRELLCMVADNEDNLVGIGISLPSMTRALQKSRGKMLPFGWIPLLKALKGKKAEVIDLMLIAIDADYQNKGLTAIVMKEVIEGMHKMGAKYVETNPELETNSAIHNQWDMFEKRHHKRRRAYIKHI